jgi:hypothetical protein
VKTDDYVDVEDEPVEMDVKPKKTPAEKAVKEKKEEVKEEIMTFQQKLFQLAEDVAQLASDFVMDGYNPSQSYEYVRAQQYKTIFRKSLSKNRLRHKIDDVTMQINNLEKSDKMVLTLYHAILTIKDVDSDEQETYMLWSQGADILDKGLSKAKTLMLKDFIKTNYLVSDAEDDPEYDKGTKRKFVAPAEKKADVAKAVKDDNPASNEDTTRITEGIKKIREASGDAEYGEKTLTEVAKGVTATRATVILTKLEMKAGEYNELEI